MRNMTPWGPAQEATELAPGVTVYSTAGHGGIHLSEERNALVKKKYRRFAALWSKGWGDAWYEEDCAALAVVATYPELFPTYPADRAATQLERYIND